MPKDIELMLAKLLGKIDDSSDEEQVLSEAELDELSAEQLHDLCTAKNCLALLGQMRQFDQASTIIGRTLTVGTGVEATDSESEYLFPNQELGRYRIKEKVGEGGFASVFLAHDPILDREVALKVPRPAFLSNELSLQRFLREGKAAATLDHPAIIPVFEAGNDGPFHFISMAFCAGPSLAELIADHEFDFDDRTAVAVISQIAKALSHAHTRGVIHRDIKPGNILVDAPSDVAPELADRIRLTDFGLVKFGAQNDQLLTNEGALIGTPAYMSPEQAQGSENVGVASDLFSLGTILYQLLTGELPHRKATAVQTLHAVTFDLPKPLRSRRRKNSPDLEAITLKCLQKEPGDRYESAFLLAEDLDAWLEGRPVRARLPGQLERMLTWIRKNSVIAVALAIALSSLVVGLGIALWGWSDAANKNQMYLAASQDAEFQTQRARKSLDSLIRSFELMDPFQQGNDLVTAVEVLQKARQEIDDKYKDDSEAKVELLTALARSFAGIGSFQDALSCRRAIYELLLDERGEGDSQTLDAHRELAIAEHNAGNLTKSLELREDHLVLASKYFGPTHRNTIQSMLGLGVSYREMGRIRQAVDLHERTSLLAEFAASEDELYTDVAINLAATYQTARLLDRAIEINQSELEECVRVLGESNPDTLEVMSSLAASYFVGGKRAEALEIQQRACELVDAQLGEYHPISLKYRFLTSRYQPRSQWKERGIPILLDVLQTAKQKLNEKHPSTIFYMNELGQMYRAVRDFDAAIAIHTEGLQFCNELYGPSDFRSIDLQIQLCRDYMRVGQHGMAIRLAEQAVSRIVDQVGSEHLLVTEAKQSLSLCYYMGGKHDKARRLTEENLAALKPQLGSLHWKIAISQRRYVYILLELEEFELAEQFASRMVQRLGDKAQFGSNRVARNLLANAQLALGKFDSADATVALALQEKSFGYPASAFASCVRGSVFLERQDYAAAQKWLLKPLKKLVQRFDELQFPHQRSMVIRYSETAGRLAKAVDNIEQFHEWQEIVTNLKDRKFQLELEIHSSQSDGDGKIK